MKIAVMADLHLNKTTYRSVMDRENISLSFRTADFMRAFKWSVTECIDNVKPDLKVIAGDVYDHYDPSNEVRGFFSDQLSRLCKNNIAVYIITGNHDVCQKHHALSDIEELKLNNIKIVSSPSIESFGNNSEYVRLLLFPYSLDIERGIKTIKGEFNSFLDKARECGKIDYPTLFFGHFPVCGGIMNRYNPGEDENILMPLQIQPETETDTTATLTNEEHQEAYKNRNENDIGFSDLDELSALNVEYVFLGDFHEYQFVDTKKCRTWYCGSLEKNSFNEKKHVKSFMVYDSKTMPDSKMGLCKIVAYPNCRPMIDLSGNIVKMREQFNKVDLDKNQDAIVRLNFEGTDEERAEFMVNLEEFKKEIISKVKAIHIYHSIAPSKVNRKDISDVLAKIEQSVQDKGHMEAIDVIEVVKEMITERVSDETERKETSELAMEIYNKTVTAGK
jgi:DNA repair exonuclease SbcCD nuclease subunit